MAQNATSSRGSGAGRRAGAPRRRGGSTSWVLCFVATTPASPVQRLTPSQTPSVSVLLPRRSSSRCTRSRSRRRRRTSSANLPWWPTGEAAEARSWLQKSSRVRKFCKSHRPFHDLHAAWLASPRRVKRDWVPSQRVAEDPLPRSRAISRYFSRIIALDSSSLVRFAQSSIKLPRLRLFIPCRAAPSAAGSVWTPRAWCLARGVCSFELPSHPVDRPSEGERATGGASPADCEGSRT